MGRYLMYLWFLELAHAVLVFKKTNRLWGPGPKLNSLYVFLENCI